MAAAPVSWAGLGPAEILERSRVLAVVGCSRRPWKAAHEVPEELQRRGFRIIPVHPVADEILGERVFRALADIGEPIDTVVVFRPSPECAGVAKAAIAAGARAVWLQLGLSSDEARRAVEAAGLGYVEDLCSMVVAAEHGIRAAAA